MVGGALRHLKSLRLMKRDYGWIHQLIEEAENERMHLLTFLNLRKPGFFFRLTVLAAQGFFWNAYFIAYLISPTFCHSKKKKIFSFLFHSYSYKFVFPGFVGYLYALQTQLFFISKKINLFFF